MTNQEAIEKVVKLLRLSESKCNEAEAALAAARAQEIIDRYQIESLALEYAQNTSGEAKPDEPVKDFASDPLDGEVRTLATWAWRLFLVIGNLNGVKGYRAHGGGLALVGRPSDVATVRYLYGWLKREVNRLAERDTVGNGRTYANNFRLGVVDTIKERMNEQKEATRAAMRAQAGTITEGVQTCALVHVNSALAKLDARLDQTQNWMDKNLKLCKASRSRTTFDPHARAAGRAAGREINFTRASGSLGSPSRSQLGA